MPYSRDAAEGFHALHEQRYGFSNPGREFEIVNLRVRLRIPSEPYTPQPEPLIPGDGSYALRGRQEVFFAGAWHTTPIYDRERLQPGDTFAGPALIAEYTSCTVLPPGTTLRVDALRNLILDIEATP